MAGSQLKPELHGRALTPKELESFKTLWRDHAGADVWQFYCPLCKVARRLPSRPSPTFRHLLQVLLTVAVFMLATWKWFAWKGLVAFIPFWAVFETVQRTRVRAALSCGNCGFDPYLFLADVQRAKTEVSRHWRRKFAEKGIEFPEPPR